MIVEAIVVIKKAVPDVDGRSCGFDTDVEQLGFGLSPELAHMAKAEQGCAQHDAKDVAWVTRLHGVSPVGFEKEYKCQVSIFQQPV